jgi:hypothetical protein
MSVLRRKVAKKGPKIFMENLVSCRYLVEQDAGGSCCILLNSKDLSSRLSMTEFAGKTEIRFA